ncbi:MAG: hydrogenase maturation protease [Wenzhouxiangellaceae bacterium]
MQAKVQSGGPESFGTQAAAPDSCHYRCTVIGIGNSLMGDDGAGIHVIEQLKQRNIGDDVLLLDGGTLSFTLLEEVERTRHLIVVDAAELHAEPGTVREFHDAEMDDYLGNHQRPSVHEINLLDVLTAARLLGRMPRHYSLFGIQPVLLDWSTEPSEAVRAGISVAADRIAALLGAQR